MRRGEGNPVVAADGARQSAFLEQALKGGKGEIFAIGFQCLTPQQVARAVIGDGQRIAIASIAQLKLALVIGAPEIFGLQASIFVPFSLRENIAPLCSHRSGKSAVRGSLSSRASATYKERLRCDCRRGADRATHLLSLSQIGYRIPKPEEECEVVRNTPWRGKCASRVLGEFRLPKIGEGSRAFSLALHAAFICGDVLARNVFPQFRPPFFRDGARPRR